MLFLGGSYVLSGLLWWLSGKELSCNAGDVGWIPGSGRSPGEGNGNPLQYSCLENPTDRRAWQAIVCGVAKSQTQLKQLSTQNGLGNLGEGNGIPLQYSCLENPIGRGAW